MIKFKWMAYGSKLQYFILGMHLIYLALLFTYTQKVYLDGDFTIVRSYNNAMLGLCTVPTLVEAL